MTKEGAWARRDILRLGAAMGVGGVLAGLSRSSYGAETRTPLKVNIVNTASNNTFTLQELLKQQGYFEEFGLEPTTLNVADGSKLMGALLSGSSDICMLSGFGQVFPAIEKGGALKIVGGAGLLLQQALYSGKPDIHSVKDLEGKTIGTGSPGALLHQFTTALLRKKGVDLKKVQFVNIGSSADVFRAVVAGVVDAGPALSDVYEQQAKYGVHSLKDGDLWVELPEYTYQGSYASVRAISERREALVRTLAAYCKLYRFISSPSSKDAFIRARVAALKNADPAEGDAEWRFIQKNQPYAVNLTLSEERIRYMQALNLEAGVQKQILPYDQVTDMSLARDAVKLLS